MRARDPGVLGAIGWWDFDIAALWASFRAFGEAPPLAVIVMGLLRRHARQPAAAPGRLGGVDGGMIGAFTAFGVDVGLAVVAVLTYRAFAFWLPTIPGAIAYFQLRRTRGRVARGAPARREAAVRAGVTPGLGAVTIQSKVTYRRARAMQWREVENVDHRGQRPGRLHGRAVHVPREPASRW